MKNIEMYRKMYSKFPTAFQKVDPRIISKARVIADFDNHRIEILSPTAVIIHNKKVW